MNQTAQIVSTILKRRPMWEGRGFRINASTIDEVIQQANLDWTVSKRPLFTTVMPLTTPNGQVNPPAFTPADVAELMGMTEDYAIVRNDNNKPFGTVGASYLPLDNKDCISVVEDLMTEFGLTAIRAGHFFNGAYVWVVCQMPEPLVIKGKEFYQFIRISWAHDGTAKLSGRFEYLTPEGLMTSPEIPGTKVEISIRHTRNAPERATQAKTLIAKQQEHALKYKEIVERMIETKCLDFREYMLAIFPKSDDDKSREKKTVDALEESYYGLEEDIRGTFYGAYVTVLDYAEEGKVTRLCGVKGASESEIKDAREDLRLRNNFIGASLTLKQKAWAAIAGHLS